MKVLILGGDGMLGHQVARQLRDSYEVVATIRKPPTRSVSGALAGCKVITGLDARVPDVATTLLLDERPRVVINAVGIVKQREAVADPLESIAVNSLFPHRLASSCRLAGARLIHISTDCVFSGKRGDYTETDIPDPVDLYGRSKLLGEVTGTGCLTIRTSIIGLELAHYSGLIEWFLRQKDGVCGYRRALWNGLTTMELARVLDRVIRDGGELHGVWHVSAEPISKYHLLAEFARRLERPVSIEPSDEEVVDRTLNSELFRATVPYAPPGWGEMLSELASAVHDREDTSDV